MCSIDIALNPDLGAVITEHWIYLYSYTIGGLIPCRISAGVPSGLWISVSLPDCITAEPGLSKAIVMKDANTAGIAMLSGFIMAGIYKGYSQNRRIQVPYLIQGKYQRTEMIWIPVVQILCLPRPRFLYSSGLHIWTTILLQGLSKLICRQ